MTNAYLLDYANDWKLQVDFEDRKLVFPPIICSTNLRPDAVLWSCLSRTVILLELTCCAEEGIQGAQTEKKQDIMICCKVAEQKWTAKLLTLGWCSWSCWFSVFTHLVFRAASQDFVQVII
jgi:hypothetical protein